MDDQNLCQLLEKLQGEIEAAQSVDAKELELLRNLDEDIRALLARCEEEQVIAHPLTIQRLEDTTAYLAVNHPTLTSLLSQISTILSNAGI